MIYTLDTDWPRPPLSENDRLHPLTKAKLVKKIRQTAQWWAEGLAIPEQEHVTVHMFWFVKDKRRRDEDNLISTAKPFYDGLVDAGIVPDDIPKFMTKHMPVVILNKEVQPGIRFVLETQ
jgi:Endodeoxyribonuclease RusA.